MKNLLFLVLCLIVPAQSFAQYISNSNFTFTPIGLKVDASGSVGIVGAVQANSFDAFGNPITSTGGALNVNIPGQVNVTVTASALPTGAATSALQTTGNSSLSSIDSKVPANLTVSSTRLLVDGSGVTQPVSGSVSVSNFPATQTVTQSGTWTTGRTWNLNNATDSVNIGNFPATQPVSGSVSVSNFPVSQNVVVTSIPTVTASAASNLNATMINLTTTVTAQTISAPANAVGFVFESDSSNATNVRYAIGATATASVGTLMEPGRDSGFIPSGANISVISTSGSPTVSVQWIQR